MKNLAACAFLSAVVSSSAGCAGASATADDAAKAPAAAAPGIVGVWELSEVRFPASVKMIPQDLWAIMNKKDVYTKDGVFHDTDANSTRKTDTDVRTYKCADGALTVFDARGKGRTVKILSLSATDLEFLSDDGVRCKLKRLSDDPDRIPWRMKKHADVYVDGKRMEWSGE